MYKPNARGRRIIGKYTRATFIICGTGFMITIVAGLGVWPVILGAILSIATFILAWSATIAEYTLESSRNRRKN